MAFREGSATSRRRRLTECTPRYSNAPVRRRFVHPMLLGFCEPTRKRPAVRAGGPFVGAFSQPCATHEPTLPSQPVRRSERERTNGTSGKQRLSIPHGP